MFERPILNGQCTDSTPSVSYIPDHCMFLGNYPPTPPLSQHFALSEK